MIVQALTCCVPRRPPGVSFPAVGTVGYMGGALTLLVELALVSACGAQEYSSGEGEGDLASGTRPAPA